jgi:hypothetical protein
MTVDEVRTLPLAQKVQIMEALWEEFRDRLDHSDVPQRIKDLLDQRRSRVREGVAKIVDWDAVKASLGRP